MERQVLDQDISQAFNLLAVLLVFVIAYFSYLVPTVSAVVQREPSGASAEDKKPVKAALRAQLYVVGAYMAVTGAVLLLLIPLSARVWAVIWNPETPFPTIEWGLLLVDLFLILLFLTGVSLLVQLGRHLGHI